MITLVNRSKTAQVFNLSPCPGSGTCGPCYCSTVVQSTPVELPDGSRGMKQTQKRLVGSLTLLAGEQCAVPDWVAQCTEIKRALDRGAIRLIQQQAPLAAPVAKSPQAVASSPQASRSNRK